jgi:hypothetical protein
MLHGSADDAAAAVYEAVARFEGAYMRWTQMEAVRALMDGQWLTWRRQGKSIVYYAWAGRKAVRGAVQALDTRDNLAALNHKILEKLFGRNGLTWCG